jgi:hypothetical protein
MMRPQSAEPRGAAIATWVRQMATVPFGSRRSVNVPVRSVVNRITSSDSGESYEVLLLETLRHASILDSWLEAW